MPELNRFEDNSADHLRLVIDSGHIGLWELDLQTGHAIRNGTHDQIFGYPEPLAEWTYEMFLDHVVEDDRERVDELQKLAIANDQEWAFQCMIRNRDGRARWISAAGRPLFGPERKAIKLIGHVIDITETKQREARLALLTEELNHRVRNMLAMVRSMVKLSASKAADIPSFAAALEGRVGALARSHQLLVADPNTSSTPSAILETELDSFPGLRERLQIEQTDEREVNSTVGQGLALVFHELITNAIKYGALSNQSGLVEVRINGNDSSVRIQWKERGGPEVSPRESRGFGSTLIAGAIGAHGRVDLTYPVDGVECEITLNL